MQLKEVNKILKRTPLYGSHVELGARIIEFAGWSMPLNYPEGILFEHLTTRKNAGLFDISHMGRFIISGKDGLSFLQHIFSNNAEALKVDDSQYTILSDKNGTAIDDAYLYRFYQNEYLMVVNASNSDKDLKHLKNISRDFKDISIKDVTGIISMLSLQGPQAEKILLSVTSSGKLPEPIRNRLSILKISDMEVLTARTGYTGESLGFELFLESKGVKKLWTLLLSRGPSPVGLGARDTLRLEAGLPLYGHELGIDSGKKELPRVIKKIEVLEKGVARPGDRVYFNNSQIGYITSGTIVPHWVFQNVENKKKITEDHKVRSIALALIDSERREKDILEVEVRSRRIKAIIMPYFLDLKSPPFSYPVTAEDILYKTNNIRRKETDD